MIKKTYIQINNHFSVSVMKMIGNGLGVNPKLPLEVCGQIMLNYYHLFLGVYQLTWRA